MRHKRRANSSRLCEPQKSNLLVRRLASTLLTFFEIPQILRTFPVRDVTRTLSPVSSSQAIVTSLSDMSALCARTRYHLHRGCTQPTHAPSRKALSPTKPKGMNRNPSAIILHPFLMPPQILLRLAKHQIQLRKPFHLSRKNELPATKALFGLLL